MSEEEIIRVPTTDGEVVYKMTGLDNVSPPPIDVKKKEKKLKKKKKKKKKKIQTSSDIPYQVIVVCMFMGCAFMFVYVTGAKQIPTKPVGARNVSYTTRSGLHNVNTTSSKWANQTTSAAENMLRQLLKTTTFAVLCMHHVTGIRNPYRACSVHNQKANQIYFMLNPKIIGGSSQKTKYREHSIACNATGMNLRHNTVIVEWETPSSNTLYALFKDDQSIALQLAINEFDGNIHCSQP